MKDESTDCDSSNKSDSDNQSRCNDWIVERIIQALSLLGTLATKRIVAYGNRFRNFFLASRELFADTVCELLWDTTTYLPFMLSIKPLASYVADSFVVVL